MLEAEETLAVSAAYETHCSAAALGVWSEVLETVLWRSSEGRWMLVVVAGDNPVILPEFLEPWSRELTVDQADEEEMVPPFGDHELWVAAANEVADRAQVVLELT